MRPLRLPVATAATVIAAASVAIVAACQLVVGVDRVDKPQKKPDPCVHVVPPGPPEVDDDPSFQLEPFYIAVRTLGAGNGDVAGYDLDDSCTCDKREPTAHDGGASCRAVTSCDLDGGVDNAMLRTLLGDFGSGQVIDTALTFDSDIATGSASVLVYIAGYNGRANDRSIQAGFVISRGIRDPFGCADAGIPDASSGVLGDGGVFPPRWCGSDRWTVGREYVFEKTPPYRPVVTVAAYVRDYHLVAANLASSFDLAINDIEGAIVAPVVTGTLVRVDENFLPIDPDAGVPLTKDSRFFRIDDGILSGRLPIQTILEIAGNVGIPNAAKSGTPFCTTPTFNTLKQQLCQARDIPAHPTSDFDLGQDCDAVSVGLRFTAYPVIATGDPVDKAVPAGSCGFGPNAAKNLDQIYSCDAGP